METTDLGQRLRVARESAGYAVGRRFAALIGTPADQLSRFECGRRTPSLEVVKKVAEVCDVSLDWLVTGRGEGPAERSGGEAA